MQARQPTYFEALLKRLQGPAAAYLEAHEDRDPFAVLIAHILQADDRTDEGLEALLDDEKFLKAGRAYTALLLENDRLPRGEQLTLEELTLPQALLLDFFRGDADIQARAQEVLGLIERKFSQRAFQQANILLQLFETDQTTRLQNERKLFYEDMIQRLGIRRRQPLSPDEVEKVREYFADIGADLETTNAFATSDEDEIALDDLAAPITPWDDALRRMRRLAELADQNEPTQESDESEPDDDGPDDAEALEAEGDPAPAADPDAPEIEPLPTNATTLEIDADAVKAALNDTPAPVADREDLFKALTKSFDWLAAHHQINFCLLTRNPEDYKQWRSCLGDRVDRGAELMRFIPPSRWRSPADYPEIALLQLLAAHLNDRSLRDYIHATTKACYFLLLAVGDTGLESYLDAYFDWLDKTLEIDGTAFIDRLHRESTLGERTLSETLNAIYDEFFAVPLSDRPGNFTVNELKVALEKFLEDISEMNFSEVPPGHYNLGGLIMDNMLGLKYPAPEFPFKIHRIV